MKKDNEEKVRPSGSKVSIVNVMAGSLDGAIASHPDESDDERKAMGFINEADHEHVRELLASCDAVIAGGHSVNVSGGVMEVVNDAGQHPTWILCTRSGFEADAPIWNAPNTAKWLVSDQALPRCQNEAVQIEPWFTEVPKRPRRDWFRPFVKHARKRTSSGFCSLVAVSSMLRFTKQEQSMGLS